MLSTFESHCVITRKELHNDSAAGPVISNLETFLHEAIQ